MHALSMIEMGVQTSDPVVPAKTAEKSDQQFGKVLNEKQQPSQRHGSKPVNKKSGKTEGPRDKQVTAHKYKTEKKHETNGQKEPLHEAVAVNSTQSKVEVKPELQVKIQHTLVDLLKIMVKGEPKVTSESTGAIEPVLMDVPMEMDESSESIETLLVDLVQQLESTDLHGEQVLAGVDLSALVEEAQSLDEGTDKNELLVQLVAQVEAQLNRETSSLENVALAAAIMAEPSQQNVAPVVTENLAQARQVLQKALDSVVTRESAGVEPAIAEESVAVVEPQAEETLFALEEPTEEIDPRFAGLLKPRTEQRPVVQQTQTGKEQVELHNAKQQADLKQSESVDQVPVEKMVVQEQSETTVQSSVATAKQMLEGLTHQAERHLQPQGHLPVQGIEAAKAMPQTPTIHLPSGQQVTESQIFDQVVTQLSGSINGESGRMVLRLQPAELGSLKLEIMIEGDRVRANFHAQSQQVQEVLERNLPQLRNALAEQGLKIDQFQVNVDQRQKGGQFESLAQQQQHGSDKQPGWHQQTEEQEERSIPLAHLMQNGGGGISLHV